MKKLIKYIVFIIIPLCFLAGGSLELKAEFYRYVDDEGNIFYVDDIYSIPEKYRNQIKVYREKHDDLSGDDRSRALQKEN